MRQLLNVTEELSIVCMLELFTIPINSSPSSLLICRQIF